MNNRTKALAALNALRADGATLPDPQYPSSQTAIWKKLAADFPHGADVATDVAKMLGQIVSNISRALPEPFCVHLDRDSSGVIGIIVCPSATETAIVPVRVRESVVQFADEVFFVGRAHGREALRLKIINTVARELERAVEN